MANQKEDFVMRFSFFRISKVYAWSPRNVLEANAIQIHQREMLTTIVVSEKEIIRVINWVDTIFYW